MAASTARWVRVSVGVLSACVGVVILAAIGLFFAQPTHYRLERARSVAAPSSAVLAQITDLRALEAWQPWVSSPSTPPTVTFSPATSGVGAWVHHTDGTSSGRTTIVSIAADRVVMRHESMGVFGGAVSEQTFSLRVLGPSETEVRWSHESDLAGLARALWPFLDVPGRIEPEMDAGLARLEVAATAAASR